MTAQDLRRVCIDNYNDLCEAIIYDKKFLGGADNVVVIWKSTGQGMLKYNHTASIQRVAYNPSTLQLASCSEVDFGLWTPDQKQVTKEKVISKITSCAWASDGSLLAIGMQNGMISIRDPMADEKQRIERKAPIWCMKFIPDSNILMVGCWEKKLSIYKVLSETHKLNKETTLPFYPCGMSLAGKQASKANFLVCWCRMAPTYYHCS